MEKKLAKEIRNLIKNSVLGTSYIDNVRSALFFVSKMIYLLKFSNGINCSENFIYNNFVNKMKLYINKNVLLYEEYREFEFIDKNIEEKVFNIVVQGREETNICNINLSKLYEEMTSDSEKKQLGQVYTPEKVIDEILDSVFKEIEVHKDIKILDPSCGGGYFLVKIVDRLGELFVKNNISMDGNIFEYIVANNLYAVDLDRFSTFLSKITLVFRFDNPNFRFNFYNCDFLLDFNSGCKFDAIVGNPPYIGHKKIGLEYGKKLKDKYCQVYYDKSDISYCFFVAAYNYLKDGGVVAYITSRYFLEAKNADRLRRFLGESYRIISLEDYNGKKLFKNAIISPAVIALSKSKAVLNKKVRIVKHRNEQKEEFVVSPKDLCHKDWMLLNPQVAKLYDKLKGKTNGLLKDVAFIKQGIITGLDKAFVVDKSIIDEYGLEKKLLRKWIKNSNIHKNNITYDNLYVIYTNLIVEERKYPNTINYLNQFKDRLSNRRECRNGLRRWFDLQWCRELEFFEKEKIVFPYKASSNRFAIDNTGYLCSADVYLLGVKDEKVSLEVLLGYLNSYIFEFMFKCRAKKVGDKLYEYYPNVLENTEIYLGREVDELCSKDVFLDEVFNLSDKDKNIIFDYINKDGEVLK